MPAIVTGTVNTRKFSEFVAEPVTSVVGLTGGANAIGPNSGGGGGSGGVTQVIIQNNSFSVGQWVRFDEATNLYVTALATTPEFAEVIGVVIAVAPPGGPPFTQFTLQQSGYITIAQAVFGALTPGVPYFLSDTVSGGMMPSDTIIDGEVSRPVFIPDATNSTNTSGWVLPYRGIIDGGGPDTGIPGPGPTPGTDSNIVTINQNGHGFNPGEWLRVGTPTTGPNQVHYVLAIADILTPDSQSVGVVIEVIDANNFVLQFAGYVSGTGPVFAPFQYVSAPGPTFSALVPATIYYLSTTVAGQMVAVDPGLSGGFSKPLYVSEQTTGTVNTNAGYILPQRPLAAAVENNPLLKTITQTAHGFIMIGTVVKPSTTIAGAYVPAIATSFVPSYGTAMIVAIPDVNTIILQEVGYVTGLDVAPPVPGGIANTAVPFGIGQPYYLSTSTVPVSGQITLTEPVSPNFSKPMFMPDQTGAGWILPMKPTIGHGGTPGGAGAWQVIETIDLTGLQGLTQSNIPALVAGTYNDIKIVGENIYFVTPGTPNPNYTSQVSMQLQFGGVFIATNTYNYDPGNGYHAVYFGYGLRSYAVLTINTQNGWAFNFEMFMLAANSTNSFKVINLMQRSNFYAASDPTGAGLSETNLLAFTYDVASKQMFTGFDLQNYTGSFFASGTLTVYGRIV